MKEGSVTGGGARADASQRVLRRQDVERPLHQLEELLARCLGARAGCFGGLSPVSGARKIIDRLETRKDPEGNLRRSDRDARIRVLQAAWEWHMGVASFAADQAGVRHAATCIGAAPAISSASCATCAKTPSG